VPTETITQQPVTYRLPKPGHADQFFGFSRAWYYQAEKRGWLKLIRIRDAGKERGVTLIKYEAVAAFVSQAEAQAKEASEREKEAAR
jgi:hypothetical protein